MPLKGKISRFCKKTATYSRESPIVQMAAKRNQTGKKKNRRKTEISVGLSALNFFI
jgi:hypothetical protein